jgi:hypothetical protein
MIFLSTSGEIETLATVPRRQLTVFDGVCVGVLMASFLYMALPSLAGGFQPDEMTSIYYYWALGSLKSLWSNVCIWNGMGRPAGALYYLPLYHFFWLNPKPYHIAQISILAASIPIVFYLARLLSFSRAVAVLAVVGLYFHPQLANLVYLGSYIYDVLCGLFYFAALTYYVHIRERGLLLRPAQLLVFLALYVCALNSKEMAVTLPSIVLIYEALKCPRLRAWQEFVRRNRRFAVPSLIAGLITLPYIYGKTISAHALAKLGGYRPEYSWPRFVTNNARFVNELLAPYHALFPDRALVVFPKAIIALWAAVFVYAVVRRDRTLQLMAFWIVIVPLPLAFVPIRGGACLYLVLFGWAMIFGQVASDVLGLIGNCLMRLGRRLGFELLNDQRSRGNVPNTRVWSIVPGMRPGKISAFIFRPFAIVLLGSVGILARFENQRWGRVQLLVESGQKVVHVIQALRSLDLRPAPGSAILLKENSLFPNARHAVFIAALVWNDHSLRISVKGTNELDEQQTAKMNYIISLSEFQATLEQRKV